MQHENQFSQADFDKMISGKIRLIRTEADLTQDKMAETIGISKKTLVQVEKGRQTLGFTAAALVAVLFRRGEIMQSMLGDSALEVVDLVATKRKSKASYKTMGGKVWWTEEKKTSSYIVQRHILTGHYRILDHDHYLQFYSMDRKETLKRLQELESDER